MSADDSIASYSDFINEFEQADKIIVFYHDYCPDAITSLWCLYSGFRNGFIPRGVSDRCKIIDEDLELVEGKEVYMIDFTFNYEIMRKIADLSSKLTIIDHHISSKKDIEKLQNDTKDNENAENKKIKVIFDVEKCAAELCWDFAHSLYKHRPWFIDIVAQRDLWKWKDEDSKMISKGLFCSNYFGGAVEAGKQKTEAERLSNAFEKLYGACGFKIEHHFVEDDSGITIDEEFVAKLREELRKIGADAITAEEKEIDDILQNGKKCSFEMVDKNGDPFYSAIAYLLTGKRKYRSDACNKACEKFGCDFAVFYNFDEKEQTWNLAMRCLDESRADLLRIGKYINPTPGASGGHKKAAGTCIVGTEEDLFTVFKKLTG
jgi:hypothetical protein